MGKIDIKFYRALNKEKQGLEDGLYTSENCRTLIDVIESDLDYRVKMHKIAQSYIADAWKGSVEAAEKLIEMYGKYGFELVETKTHELNGVSYSKIELVRK